MQINDLAEASMLAVKSACIALTSVQSGNLSEARGQSLEGELLGADRHPQRSYVD